MVRRRRECLKKPRSPRRPVEALGRSPSVRVPSWSAAPWSDFSRDRGATENSAPRPGARSSGRSAQSPLGFTGSSAPSSVLRAALRAAADGAVVGVLAAGVAAAAFRGAATRRGLVIGAGAAWLASSASGGWLLWGRSRSSRAFWWSFGGGMALRCAALAGLMVWSWKRAGVSAEALLLSYVFGVLAMALTMETRRLKLR